MTDAPPKDIAARLIWCSIHGDQMQAIEAMEAGSKEIERLRAVEAASSYILDAFKKDEEQGYRSRDRQFAISILGVALTRKDGA